MSIFFKKMNQNEIASWNKAAVAGFYAMLLLLIADLASCMNVNSFRNSPFYGPAWGQLLVPTC